MKTQTVKTTMATLLLAIILLGTYGCGSANTGSNQSDTKAPPMAIHGAVVMGDMKMVQQHIDAKTDLNAKDEYGATALTVAATFDKPEIVKLLLDAGANVNATSGDGSTALHTAAFFGRTEIVKLLLSNGVDTEIRNNFGATALESVLAPFESMEMIYDQIGKDLKPLGLTLDYDKIKASRPEIMQLIQQH